MRSGASRSWATAGQPQGPGRVEPAAVLNQTYHHALVCHGTRCAPSGRLAGPARASASPTTASVHPGDRNRPGHRGRQRLVRRANLHILDPSTGSYSPTIWRGWPGRAARAAGDFGLIGAPTDFLGLKHLLGGVCPRGSRRGLRGRPAAGELPRRGQPLAPPVAAGHLLGSAFRPPELRPASDLLTENGCGYDVEPVAAARCSTCTAANSCAATCASCSGRSGRRSGQGLFPLVIHGQLRVGGRLHPPLRHRPCGLRTQARTRSSRRYYSETIRLNRVL